MKERFEKFILNVASIYRSVQKIKAFEMEGYDGLKGNASMCVFLLDTHDEGLTITELASLCNEDKAAVSRSISLMEKYGYVKSDPPHGKNYRNKLTLTEKGKICAQNIGDRIDAAVINGGDNLTDCDRRIFYACLVSIADNLEKYTHDLTGEQEDHLHNRKCDNHK